MPTLNLQVAASSDDAFENNTGVVSIGFANLLVIDAVDKWHGYRFTNVTIPKDSPIASAILQLMPTSTSDMPNIAIRGQAIDDAPTFTTGANDISSRSLTTASVTWSSADLGADGLTFFSSPDISSVIQEIVNRAGWVSGNDLVILYNGGSDASRDFAVRGYDGTPAQAAKLDIVYAIGPAVRSVYHHLVGGMR